ncbi:hypothetical protein OIU77_018590 [Salix suchowensis]|uniref:Uncharacterized protein n=1 Tax=Salix suchowensis TaxID=1278906 RepID=A0ABQ9CG31_9ROSI|nr:hypothetical protein OIU77_018590 [Salix suchowensis]
MSLSAKTSYTILRDQMGHTSQAAQIVQTGRMSHPHQQLIPQLRLSLSLLMLGTLSTWKTMLGHCR